MAVKKSRTVGDNATVLNPGNVPVVRAGGWHTLPMFGAAGTLNLTNNRLYALPLWPGRRCVMVGVAINVTLALLGGAVRIGVYRSGNGLPGPLVQDFGTVSTSVGGIQQLTGFHVTLEPRLYFLGVGRQLGGLTLGVGCRDTWDPLVSETVPTLAGNLNCYYVDGIAGALPELFGAVAGTIQGPSASVQLT